MRRAKRAVWVLATLVVLALAGCTTPSSSPTTSATEATTSVPTTTTAQKFTALDQMVGRWKVTYTLTSVKPASKRSIAAETPKTWECIVYSEQMRLTSGTRAYTGKIVMTGKESDKSWNYKGQADYAGRAGEVWTSDIDVDGKLLSNDSFSAKQAGTVTSNLEGRVYTATWSIKGTRIP